MTTLEKNIIKLCKSDLSGDREIAVTLFRENMKQLILNNPRLFYSWVWKYYNHCTSEYAGANCYGLLQHLGVYNLPSEIIYLTEKEYNTMKKGYQKWRRIKEIPKGFKVTINKTFATLEEAVKWRDENEK